MTTSKFKASVIEQSLASISKIAFEQVQEYCQYSWKWSVQPQVNPHRHFWDNIFLAPWIIISLYVGDTDIGSFS